jgi:alkylation response protein AidB-like acyl-CoA dehydrogenase
MAQFKFEPIRITRGSSDFRNEIRQFLKDELAGAPAQARANSWSIFDPAFSRKLGALGWIGMTWPKKYGGHERSAIDRYVLLEELLAAGAPVGAHWTADRQSGPAIIRYGNEEQRVRYLPGMAAGNLYCCIGMSEPNSGSDLASVRTRAEQLSDGRWRINGQKIWTSQAHHCHLMIALVRTGGYDDKARHAGLSQLLIDLATPGITIVPIVDLVGQTHFCEVFFDDAVVSADSLLGAEGEGWKQCTSELSLERSGPERYMSSLSLFLELLRVVGTNPSTCIQQALGRIAAEFWSLRQMSISVAAQLARGEDPALEAAIVKDLGNSFEQALPSLVQALTDDSITLEDDSDFSRTLGLLLQTSPSFSLRGGTREILRGIIARGLGLR